MKNIYTKISNDRIEKYGVCTRIVLDDESVKHVIKTPMTPAALPHVEGLISIYDSLCQQFSGTPLIPNVIKAIDGGVELEYIEGDSLEHILEDLYYRGDMDAMYGYIDRYADYIAKAFSGKDAYIDIDAIFQNIIIASDDHWIVFDYEWSFKEEIPYRFILYRALWHFCYYLGALESELFEALKSRYGISKKEILEYTRREADFQAKVYGKNIGRQSTVDLAALGAKPSYEVRLVGNNVIPKALKEVEAFAIFDRDYVSADDLIRVNKIDDNGISTLVIEKQADMKILRVDVANAACMMKLISSSFSKDDIISINALEIDDNLYAYYNDDPQLIIDVSHILSDSIAMTFKLSTIDKAVNETISNKINTYINKLDEDSRAIEEAKRVIEDKNSIISNQNQTIGALDQERARLTAEVNNKVFHYENSRSWRLTRPLRRGGDFIRNHEKLRRIAKAIKVLLKQGPKGVMYALRTYSLKRDGIIEDVGELIFNNKLTPLEIGEQRLFDLPAHKSIRGKIAVHIHLFYTDLFEEMFGFINKIPYPFDVFVSVPDGTDIEDITRRASRMFMVRRVVVRPVPNRGRDIAPLLVTFRKEIREYDYFLHIHSKKSLYSGKEQKTWRVRSLMAVLGSTELIRRIISLFEDNSDIGLIYPEPYGTVAPQAYHWLKSEAKGMELLRSLGVSTESGIMMFPAGSFYWGRVKALDKLFDKEWTIDDFEEEAGQTDGMIPHVIERAIGIISRDNGYYHAQVDIDEGVLRDETPKKAINILAQVNRPMLLGMLSKYDVISFDIFDTIITRAIYKPDDLFMIMGAKIKTMYGIDIDYLKARKDAEGLANSEHGAYTNIYNIYEKLPEVSPFSREQADALRQMEIDLEYELCLPRKDVVDLFNELKAMGKTVIMVSDMYMDSPIIERMLKKAGIKEYDKLYVSCELGLRKDADTIWDKVLSEYSGKRLYHLGDHFRSDWQCLIDRGLESTILLNPRDMLKILPCDRKLNDMDDGSIMYSLSMGMTINGGVCNSPFSMYGGGIAIDDAHTLGRGALGPLIAEFLLWVHNSTSPEDVLGFITREGFVLEPLYKELMYTMGKEPRKNFLLHASRRAVSMAALRDFSDIEAIAEANFDGPLDKLLFHRYGIEDRDKKFNQHVVIDKAADSDDKPMIIDILRSYEPEILDRAKKEKQSYLEYMRTQIDPKDWSRLKLVDIGYAGSTQYFLSLAMETPIDGRYLSARSGEYFRPNKLGIEPVSMYPETERVGDYIISQSLFYEVALSAEEGQLIRFDNKAGLKPIRKESAPLNSDVKALQAGMKECARLYGLVLKDTGIDSFDTVIGQAFLHLFSGAIVAPNLIDSFAVEDDYVQGGMIKYHKDTNMWGK